MLHLTLSGYDAGKTICGTPKNANDTYQHYSLTYSIEKLDNLCPKCKRLYNQMEIDDYTEEDYEYEKRTGRCCRCGEYVNECNCE